MARETAVDLRESASAQWITSAALGVVACVLADMVHEALGHGTASLLTGNRILSLSTVAIQNAMASRTVAAAGTAANCIVGSLSLLAFHRAKKLTLFTLFLWLFAAFNLLNAGYLVVSAALNNGDWAVVIADRSPSWLWRSALGMVGATLYVLFVRWAASAMIRRVEDGEIGVSALWANILAAYIGGGVVMMIASVFNPIGPSLILLSGMGASFGLNAGLLWVPGIVAGKARTQSPAASSLPASYFWIAMAVVLGGLFVAILGPGIHFSN
ncbi:MAG TPA: hypothetical protein VKZ53_25750 [Candidatus Angelobacter sp.]|nr:hypothetical protein [Candidatus Angelobacter sp.]